MDDNEFLTHGQEVLDWIDKYVKTIKSRRVLPDVEPGYLVKLLPDEAPMHGESWKAVMDDLDSKIIKGITHWQHPRFHAYFPAGNNYPCILADMVSGALGCDGFSWISSPAYTELEVIVLDWLGKAIGLPDQFISSASMSKGGGCMEGSSSDAIFATMLSARHCAIKYQRKLNPALRYLHDSNFIPKLVAYTSEQAHSSVEKAAKLALVEIKLLNTDENEGLRGKTLAEEMEQDLRDGKVPFYVCATLGTTGCCSFDNIDEIGKIINNLPCCWLHVDMAYAGSSFLCPEMRHHLQGIENANSVSMNPYKMMTVSFTSTCLWVRNVKKYTETMVVNPLFLEDNHQCLGVNFRHWGTPLSRRIRSLKLWFTLRSYGIQELQACIRHQIKLAKRFELKLKTDPRFVIMNRVELGLVCFRLNDTDEINQKLLVSINKSADLHIIPAMIKGKFIIRFAVTCPNATEQDVDTALDIIKKHAATVLHPTTSYKKTIDKFAMFSFSRNIPRHLCNKRRHLKDWATPILVPDENLYDLDNRI